MSRQTSGGAAFASLATLMLAAAMTAGCKESVTLPAPLVPAAFVAAGGDQACALTGTGTAYCWGENFFGQLGNGTTARSAAPLPVSGNVSFTAIGTGGAGTCGIASTGLAYCWGSYEPGRDPPTGSVVPVVVSGGLTLRTLARGSSHTCGLTSIGSGAAYCWGDNYFGQLGDSSRTDSAIPVAVAGGLIFSAIAAGSLHSCALSSAGAAYCWGDNLTWQLGDSSRRYDYGSSTPIPVSGGMTFDAIAAGGGYNCALTTAGMAYCWGDNLYGQLGNDTLRLSAAPVPVSGGLRFVVLAAGVSHTCGLTRAATAYCWGGNVAGQLGDSSFTDSAIPVAVAGGLIFTAIAAADYHTCALTRSAAVYCWGANHRGQLGNGTYSPGSPVPVQARVFGPGSG